MQRQRGAAERDIKRHRERSIDMANTTDDDPDLDDGNVANEDTNEEGDGHENESATTSTIAYPRPPDGL